MTKIQPAKFRNSVLTKVAYVTASAIVYLTDNGCDAESEIRNFTDYVRHLVDSETDRRRSETIDRIESVLGKESPALGITSKDHSELSCNTDFEAPSSPRT